MNLIRFVSTIPNLFSSRVSYIVRESITSFGDAFHMTRFPIFWRHVIIVLVAVIYLTEVHDKRFYRWVIFSQIYFKMPKLIHMHSCISKVCLKQSPFGFALKTYFAISTP